MNNRTVQRFLDWLRANHQPRRAGKQELSTHTVGGYIRTIWTFMYCCLSDDEYGSHVKLTTVKGIKIPRTEQVVKGTFTDTEIEALFQACQHSDKPHEYQVRDKAILRCSLTQASVAGDKEADDRKCHPCQGCSRGLIHCGSWQRQQMERTARREPCAAGSWPLHAPVSQGCSKV